MLSERAMMLIGQLYLAVLSLVIAIAPHYYWLVFIVYIVAMMALGMYSARGVSGKVSREEVVKARTLMKEDKAFEIAMEDEDLIRLYAGQAKSMMIMLLLLPIYYILFRAAAAYHDEVVANLNSIGIHGVLAGFVFWLLVFEAMFLLSQASRKLMVGGGVKQPPLVPHGFRVTEKGIVMKGSMGQVIGFPLPEGSEVKLNESKNYVEIRYPKGSRVRLYTRKARKLYEYIVRYGLAGRVEGKEASKEPA